MKRILIPFAMWVVFAGAGCGAPQEGPPPAASGGGEVGAPAGGAPAAVPMKVEGYQVVRVVVRDTGYTPDRIRLQAGVPVKMVFVQESTSHCAAQIMIPAMGVPATDLPPGKETVVEFSPAEAGTYAFTCGMDMLRGTLEVGA